MHYQAKSRTQQITFSMAILLGWTCSFASSIHAHADEAAPTTSTASVTPPPAPQTTGPTPVSSHPSVSKLRMKLNSEFMTPPLSTESNSVPGPAGEEYQPMNLFSIFWADYEIAPHFRLLYWQRALALITPGDADGALSVNFRDPRFAVRYSNQFLNKNISFTADTYIQAPLSAASSKMKKIGDIGFRTATTYTPSGSRFTVGTVTDLNTSFYSETGTGGTNFLAAAAPFMEYTINKNFTTEHWLALTLYHKRDVSWSDLTWNDQAPYMQNGITWNATDSLSVSALLNNYLTALPSVHNSWISLWVSVAFI